jgi:hypothetical protein
MAASRASMASPPLSNASIGSTPAPPVASYSSSSILGFLLAGPSCPFADRFLGVLDGPALDDMLRGRLVGEGVDDLFVTSKTSDVLNR